MPDAPITTLNSDPYFYDEKALDDFLRRKPNVALNRVHTNKQIAIDLCPGATDRIIPESLVSQDLDDFLCRTYHNFDILGRRSSTTYRQPICVGDTVIFSEQIIKQRDEVSQLRITAKKNGGKIVRDYEITIVRFRK